MPTPKPSPSPTKKGIQVALGNGVFMDLKTGKKYTVKPSPKPAKTKSDSQYFEDQKKFVDSQPKKRSALRRTP